MSDRQNPSPTLPEVRASVHPGGELVLKLSLQNRSGETLLGRPVLDDWIAEDGEMFSTMNPVDPDYLYLGSSPAENVTQTLTVKLPSERRSRGVIKSWLRFPGLLEESVAIALDIDPKKSDIKTIEYPLQISFPIREFDPQNPTFSQDKITDIALGLTSALIDLDRIPSRWLVAELLVAVSQKGEERAGTEVGGQLLSRLRKTAFFRETSAALSAAKVPNWISETLSMSGQILNRDRREERLLYIWERWLLSLAESDVEAPETLKTVVAPPFLAAEFAAKLGADCDRWLGYFLLGLAADSPRIAVNLEAMASGGMGGNIAFDHPPQSLSISSYNLSAGLPGLDLLPARWLALELLLILAQKGDDYAATVAGETLLDRLRRTRFCKNGVLSFAAAGVPRWIAVGRDAAIAFHDAAATPTNRAGLLRFWEGWLWDIAGPKIALPQTPTAALASQLGMDGEAWFLRIVLGLSLLSPRIAATLQAIASGAPPAPSQSPSPTRRIQDVLGEPGSLQR
ncbi:MAG: hypothetical protein ACP5D7_14675 [Limnospira sp.]